MFNKDTLKMPTMARLYFLCSIALAWTGTWSQTLSHASCEQNNYKSVAPRESVHSAGSHTPLSYRLCCFPFCREAADSSCVVFELSWGSLTALSVFVCLSSSRSLYGERLIWSHAVELQRWWSSSLWPKREKFLIWTTLVHHVASFYSRKISGLASPNEIQQQN